MTRSTPIEALRDDRPGRPVPPLHHGRPTKAEAASYHDHCGGGDRRCPADHAARNRAIGGRRVPGGPKTLVELADATYCDRVNPLKFRPLETPPAGVDLPWRRDLDAGLALLQFLKSELHDTTVQTSGPVSFVVNGEFVRVLTGYEALLNLAVAGFGVQAQLCARSMFESAVTAWWARQHRGYVEENFELYERYVQNLYFEMWPRDEWDGETPPELGAAERERAKRQFGTYGERPWTGQAVRAMATEMAAALGPPIEGHLLASLGLQRVLNWTIHSTGLAIRMGMEDAGGEQHIRLGPTDRGVSDALRHGWNEVSLVCTSYAEEFGTDFQPGLAQHLGACWSALYDPQVLRGTGRNDPCPCGSGLKFKTCHGDYFVLG